MKAVLLFIALFVCSIVSAHATPLADENVGISEVSLGTRIDSLISFIVIDKIAPNSPAANKGLEVSEVILEINQTPVTSIADVNRAFVTARQNSRPAVLFKILNRRRNEIRHVAAAFINPPQVLAPVAKSTERLESGRAAEDTQQASRLADKNVGILEVSSLVGNATMINGIRIVKIEPNSPAAKKGIVEGDVILEIDQVAVTKSTEVNSRFALARHALRPAVLFKIFNPRANEERLVVAEFIEKPQAEPQIKKAPEPFVSVPPNYNGAELIKPFLIDEEGMLKEETKQKIARFALPPDIAVVIRTVKALDSSRGPLAADDLMDSETYWQTIRPRSFYSRWFERESSTDNGIYILISKEPNLLQIRFGPRLLLLAYRHGIAAGPQYRRIQSLMTSGTSDEAILKCMEWLQREVPKSMNVPTYVAAGNRFVSSFGADIEHFTLKLSLFSMLALKIYATLYVAVLNGIEGLALFAPSTSNGRQFALLMSGGVIYWLLKCALAITLGVFLFLNPNKALQAGIRAGGAVLSFVTFFFAAGTFILLSDARAEDELFLRQLGIAPRAGLLNTDGVFQTTGFGFAVAGFILFVAYEMIKKDYVRYRWLGTLPDDVQRRYYRSESRTEFLEMLNKNQLSMAADERNIQERPFAATAQYVLFYDIINKPFRLPGIFAIFICGPVAITSYMALISVVGIPLYFCRSLLRMARDRLALTKFGY